MGAKRKIRTVLKRIKSFFSVRYAVEIPVLYGELLKGRSALITGGTSGIGFAIADAFMRNGADVMITGRDQRRIDAACGALRSRNPERMASGIVLDNRDVPKMPSALERAIELGGGI